VDTAAFARPGAETLLGELNHLLWRQRSLLTELLYHLEVQQLLLAAGRDRWLPLCGESVERSLDRIARQDEAQSRLLVELAAVLPVSATANLGQLCEVVPEPWDGILGEHRAAFLTLVAETEQVSRENRELLAAGLDDVRSLIGRLGDRPEERAVHAPESGYGSLGRRRPVGARPAAALLVDRDV
jgi:hypothetical protein